MVVLKYGFKNYKFMFKWVLQEFTKHWYVWIQRAEYAENVWEWKRERENTHLYLQQILQVLEITDIGSELKLGVRNSF